MKATYRICTITVVLDPSVSRCHNKQRSKYDLWKPMLNKETGSSQDAGFHKKTSRRFLPHQPVVLVKCTCKGQNEALTPYFKRKKL